MARGGRGFKPSNGGTCDCFLYNGPEGVDCLNPGPPQEEGISWFDNCSVGWQPNCGPVTMGCTCECVYKGRSTRLPNQPMRRGGRVTRQRGGRRRYQAGGHGHEMVHKHPSNGFYTHGDWHYSPGAAPQFTTGSYSTGQAGRHYHNSGISPAGGRMRRGGRAPVRRQRGGRTNYRLRRQMGGPGSNLPTPWGNED